MRNTSRRKRTQSGSAWVETALVLIPFLTLLFGVFDISLATFVKSCLTNAVREGTRYAITYKTDALIKARVQTFAIGLLDSSMARVHVDYYPAGSTTPFASGGNAAGNVVQVSVQSYPWSFVSPLTGRNYTPGNLESPNLSFSVYSSDVMGGAPPGGAGSR